VVRWSAGALTMVWRGRGRGLVRLGGGLGPLLGQSLAQKRQGKDRRLLAAGANLPGLRFAEHPALERFAQTFRQYFPAWGHALGDMPQNDQVFGACARPRGHRVVRLPDGAQGGFELRCAQGQIGQKLAMRASGPILRLSRRHL